MNRQEQSATTWLQAWRDAIERQEAAHARIRSVDAAVKNRPGYAWTGPLPSSFLVAPNGRPTVACQRFNHPFDGGSFGCGGSGLADGAPLTVCKTCGGTGHLLSVRGLEDERARFAVIAGERLAGATDEAIAEHNKREEVNNHNENRRTS